MKSVFARFRVVLFALTAGSIGLIACGGPPQKTVNKDEIRQNADGADRSLDRESDRNKEDNE